MAAVWVYKPLERRAAEAAFLQGVAAARANDLAVAGDAFSACLAARPGRADCEAGRALVTRAQSAEESARRAAADAKNARVETEVEALAARLGARVNPDGTLDLGFRPPTDTGGSSAEPSEEDKRQAIKHWNDGIKAFQKNDYTGAKDHWTQCKTFDTGNEDCAVGLQRLARTFGGGL